MLAVIVFPVFLGLCAVAPEMIPVMFGSQWTNSVVILQVLVFIGVIHSMSKMYDTIIVSVGRPGVWLVLTAALSVTTVIGFLVGVRWGIVGVAIAYVIVGTLFVPIYLFILHRLAGIEIARYLSSIAVPAVSSLIMFVIVFSARHIVERIELHGIQLLLLVTIGALSYASIVALISPSTATQLIGVLRSVSRSKQ
jgi:PST family polysaccharide transporter